MTHSNDAYYHQDNDPKHTSRICMNYLKNRSVKLVSPPVQSPDLNPIENCWHYLEVKLKDRTCKNEKELFDTVQKGWNNIPMDYVRRLIESMPRRIQAVINAKGGPTKC